ncbi:glycosyltransferase family 4 protein [Marinicella meishanensis]|uniref:glycosyltransferase family 4 protein n=1 Tax=Marinicella meishanensis TaxID=2873263 RepID=UPI001CBEEE38
MKVILNVDAITHPLTGIGHYTLALGNALKSLQTIEELRFFSADHWVSDLQQAAAGNQWLASLRRWVPFKALALNAYGRRRARRFKQLTQGMSDHVLHSPNFILMPHTGPSVATFHDLSFVHHRDTQPAYRLQFLDREVPKTLAQANALITPTAFIKQAIVDHYGYPAEQIHVTPLGVSAGFAPQAEASIAPTLAQHQLAHKGYVLAVATTEPRKNLPRLLQAYAQLPVDLRAAHPLVLVGAAGWLQQASNQAIKQALSQGHIKTLGYLKQTELQQLYAGARLLALPSLYEGFGLPIIEAMASGTAVLTSAHSAMQEVAGGHAMLCQPEDTDSIEVGLRAALEDDAWRQAAEQAGLKHSQAFTWQRCAEATLITYRSLSGS